MMIFGLISGKLVYNLLGILARRGCWTCPKVCINLQTDVRYHYSVWRFYLLLGKMTVYRKQQCGRWCVIIWKQQCQYQEWNWCQFHHARHDACSFERSTGRGLNKELGYSKYDYRSKDMDNSQNGHSGKTMHTSYGDLSIPHDRIEEYDPQFIKKSEYRDARHGGKNPLHVCRCHDHRQHRIPHKATLWHGYLRQRHQPDYGQNTPCRKRMARTSAGRSLCRCLYGCHSLPCPQRRTYRKARRLYCPRDGYEREKGCFGHACMRKWKRQVLAVHLERSKELRRGRYSDCMCGRTDRFPAGDKRLFIHKQKYSIVLSNRFGIPRNLYPTKISKSWCQV